MTVELDARHVAALRGRGEADYPAEACGLIGGALEGDRKVAVQLVPLVNQRTDSARNRYLIDPESFQRAQARLERDGLEVLGAYHSHPDPPPAPTAFDREHAPAWLSRVIPGVARPHAAEWRRSVPTA